MAFGDPQPSSDKTKTASGLLKQIEGLLHQYLDLGDSTPLAQEAESFLSQVNDAQDRLKGEAESPAEDTAEGGEASESDGKSSPPSGFRGATKAASDAMKADGTYVKNHGESKANPFAGDSTDSEEEEKKKKGTKAFS